MVTMHFTLLHLFLFITIVTFGSVSAASHSEFPAGFIFGVASSAYQIEGAHDANGKTENIWDYHLHLDPDLVKDRSNGDIACDSYNKVQEDIALLKNLGVDFYRFSISWARLLPNGYSNKINPDGIRYYNELIDGLVARNIEPMVTMYHWDLPKKFQDLGGWTNPFMADYFEDYARILFENFGDRVKLWITFNSNFNGYGNLECPPMIDQPGVANYLYAHVVLSAHAKVYHLYDKEFRDKQKGKIGLTIDGRWFEPYDPTNEKDVEAAERATEFFLGMFANPIHGQGDFPQVIRQRIAHLSKEEGFSRSRLPTFTQEQVDYIKGSSDFLGINIYTAFLVQDFENNELTPSLERDLGVKIYQDRNWPKSRSDWLRVVPWAFRRVLKWIKDKYDGPEIYITENGFSDSGQLEDLDRIKYYESYLGALLESIHEDGVDVKGYAAWSLLDNFEWTAGYTERFGLHHVDFEDPSRKRTPKASAEWYKSLIKSRRLSSGESTDNVSSRLEGDL